VVAFPATWGCGTFRHRIAMVKPLLSAPPGARQHSTLWENVLRHFKDAVIVLDTESRVVFVNQAAEELTRMPRAKVLGRLCDQVFPDSPFLSDMVARACTMRQSETRNEESLQTRRKTVQVRITCVPLFDELGEIDGAALVVQDLSYQKALEETARRHESLARLGTLVAGLAHEVRNPLAGIKGAAQLLAQRLPDDATLREYTDVISNETDRLSNLVGDLLQLGAPPKPTLAPVNIHEVLQRVLTLLGPEIRAAGFTLHCEFDPSLPDIMADFDQLQQVFLNLIKNAVDAMAGDPARANRLSVHTKMETDYHILRGAQGAQSYLRVEINDSGPGIDPEILAHVFEPFYTTKSRGTGLGLAIAQRIISDHNGTIRAFPAEPHGTRMWVSLPIQKAP
jgi:two-component system, NtrC family, nitrogen regulation sensor histidine kinase GlnL